MSGNNKISNNNNKQNNNYRVVWPDWMNAPLTTVAGSDIDKKKQLWLHVENQQAVYSQIRSTNTSDDIIDILRVQAKTCFKGPGKAARSSSRAATPARTAPPSKATTRAAAPSVLTGNLFTNCTVLDSRSFV